MAGSVAAALRIEAAAMLLADRLWPLALCREAIARCSDRVDRASAGGDGRVLALAEGDLDHGRGSLEVRRGKGGRRREVGMDAWGWERLQAWLDLRREFPVDPPCVINGTTRGRHWSAAAARAAATHPAAAGVPRRFAPHQLRQAHAVEMARS